MKKPVASITLTILAAGLTAQVRYRQLDPKVFLPEDPPALIVFTLSGTRLVPKRVAFHQFGTGYTVTSLSNFSVPVQSAQSKQTHREYIIYGVYIPQLYALPYFEKGDDGLYPGLPFPGSLMCGPVPNELNLLLGDIPPCTGIASKYILGDVGTGRVTWHDGCDLNVLHTLNTGFRISSLFGHVPSTYAWLGDSTAKVHRLNLSTRLIDKVIPLTPGFEPIFGDANRFKLLLSNLRREDQQTLIVDIDTGQTLSTLPLSGPVRFNPTNMLFAAGDYFGGGVNIYDTNTRQRTQRFEMSNVIDLKWSWRGEALYGITGEGAGSSFFKYDLASGRVLSKITVGTTLSQLYISPTGRHAFITDKESTTLSVLGLDSMSILFRAEIGGRQAEGLTAVYRKWGQ